MLEHNARLDRGDLRSGGQGVEGKIAQVSCVPDRDVDEKVMSATHVGQPHDFWQRKHMVAKSLDQGAVVVLQMYKDDRLQADPEGLWRNRGPTGAEHACGSEPADAGMAARRRQPHAGRQFLVGQTPVFLQRSEDAEVDSVKRDFHRKNP